MTDRSVSRCANKDVFALIKNVRTVFRNCSGGNINKEHSKGAHNFSAMWSHVCRWGHILPAGLLTARYYRNYSNWFVTHKVLQVWTYLNQWEAMGGKPWGSFNVSVSWRLNCNHLLSLSNTYCVGLRCAVSPGSFQPVSHFFQAIPPFDPCPLFWLQLSDIKVGSLVAKISITEPWVTVVECTQITGLVMASVGLILIFVGGARNPVFAHGKQRMGSIGHMGHMGRIRRMGLALFQVLAAGIIGLVTMGLGFWQPFNGFLRPHHGQVR